MAVRANVRTATAAKTSLNKAFDVAYRSGSVLGLAMVGIAVFGTSTVIAIALAIALSLRLSLGLAHLKHGARVIGRKIGLTSRAMQQASKMTEPDYGIMTDDAVFKDGARVPAGRAPGCGARPDGDLGLGPAASAAGPASGVPGVR